MTSAVIILQARMGSSRLPGKVLARVGARSIVEHCLERLRLGSAAPVLLATTWRAEDDALAAVGEANGIHVFRGSEEDVLARYVLAAQSVGAQFVVRATADNPAVDIGAAERVLGWLRSSGAEHIVEHDLPYGAAVEAMTTAALVKACALATADADREHVTTLMRRDRSRFTSLAVPAPLRLRRPDVRLTVDTPDDLRFVRDLAGRMGNWETEPALDAILAAVDAMAADRRCA